jgi:hypothetical protein
MKSKYGARKTNHAGHSFASRGEAGLYDYIRALEQSREAKLKQVQPQVYLSDARILYKPDFLIEDLKLGQDVWLEFKGFETPEWRIKRRLWMFYGPGLLRVFKGYGRGLSLMEELRGKE